ncbi:MAG: signal recognition particle protein [Puniceicoccales bacterium]|jgi:signal recognition particle subunit SRP54|nr:signal recognition particle protein [Puniceicoccales bacterium]
MFEKITEKLQSAMRTLRGLNVISEKNITSALEDVRNALLDADVSFEVIKSFLESVREKSLGQKVLQSVAPGEQLIKIINDSLVELLGGGKAGEDCEEKTVLSTEKPLRILLVGLNGTGKTTTALKLARWLGRKDYSPLLVACDVRRPAAIDQLEQLAQEGGIRCFADRNCRSALEVAQKALVEAESTGLDGLIFDTAGRLQVDGELMKELTELQKVVRAQEVLLVADAALGQEAVAVAKAFHNSVGLTGIILTKADGDARGGAALSMKYGVGVPIVFVGTGEHCDDLDVFRAEGMAQRILGMGDVVALVERAQERVDRKEADRLSRRIRKSEFDLDDYLSQLEQLGKMGSLGSLMKLLPGVGNANISPHELSMMGKTKAIIRAMTPEERRRPQIIGGSRKVRIAKGSGVELRDVNHVLRQFERMKKSMKAMKTPQGKKMLKQMSASSAIGHLSKIFGSKE